MTRVESVRRSSAPRRRRPSDWATHVGALHRRLILSALVRVAAEHGIEGTSVARILAVARVSRTTFYDLFDSRDDCLLAAIDQAVGLARHRALAAWETEEDWLSRVRVALQATLEFFDEEPQLARLCVVHSNVAVPVIGARRRQVLDALASVVDAGGWGERSGPPALTAEAVVGGVVAVIHARIVEPERGGLVELLNPLMSFIVRPYRGAGAARRELHRPRRTARPAPEPTAGPPRTEMRMTYRTIRVLSAIAGQPGLSNIQASRHAGISDQGQISKLLRRLAQLGLVENTGEGQERGAANAWRLTSEGKRFVAAPDVRL
jgi:AcrR family transcriptional regulator